MKAWEALHLLEEAVAPSKTEEPPFWRRVSWLVARLGRELDLDTVAANERDELGARLMEIDEVLAGALEELARFSLFYDTGNDDSLQLADAIRGARKLRDLLPEGCDGSLSRAQASMTRARAILETAQ